MAQTSKGLRYYMRMLHRDLGFLMIGVALVYALSGLVLIFRDTDFLKQTQQVEKVLPAGLSNDEIGEKLRLRNFKVTQEAGDVVTFNTGSYNRATGATTYTTTEVRAPFNKMISLHKAPSRSTAIHWAGIIFGVILAFLALSSFWMFAPSSKPFKRSITLAAVGIVVTIALLCFA